MKLNSILYLLATAFVFVGCEPERQDIAVASVWLNETEYVLTEGDNFTLEANIYPENATNQNVSWTSDNEPVATIEGGVVTAHTTGTANIIVTTEDGQMRDTCVIEVGSSVIGVELNQSEISIVEGYMATLTAVVNPADAPNQNVSWTSDNESVATVENGVVSAKSVGIAEIIVITEVGEKTDTCIVNVKENWLGEVTFKTSQTWNVGEQTWSDAVMASRCKKNDFNGGFSNSALYADCRQNEGYGDLFSWQAVKDNEAQLCPDGWRVPVKNDFVELDKALGGTGGNGQSGSVTKDKYVNDWGAEFGGGVTVQGMLAQGTSAYYWSLSEVAGNACILYVESNGSLVATQFQTPRYTGYVLRCVK